MDMKISEAARVLVGHTKNARKTPEIRSQASGLPDIPKRLGTETAVRKRVLDIYNILRTSESNRPQTTEGALSQYERLQTLLVHPTVDKVLNESALEIGIAPFDPKGEHVGIVLLGSGSSGGGLIRELAGTFHPEEGHPDMDLGLIHSPKATVNSEDLMQKTTAALAKHGFRQDREHNVGMKGWILPSEQNIDEWLKNNGPFSLFQTTYPPELGQYYRRIILPALSRLCERDPKAYAQKVGALKETFTIIKHVKREYFDNGTGTTLLGDKQFDDMAKALENAFRRVFNNLIDTTVPSNLPQHKQRQLLRAIKEDQAERAKRIANARTPFVS